MAQRILSLKAFPLALLALAPAMSMHAQQADTTIVRIADGLGREHKCKEAGRMLAPLIDREVPVPDALLVRAKCRIQVEERPQEGMQDLERALEVDPKNFNVRLYRGDLYNDLQMFDRAAADLDDAVAFAPDTAQLIEALNRRSWNSYGLRRFDLVKTDCRRVFAMDSTNRAALNNMALASNETGDTATAFRMLKAMIRLDPKDDVGWLNTGFFLGTIGRHQEALYYYDQAEQMGRRDARFFNNRGFSRLGVGDLKGARKDIERSIDLDPLNAYAFRNLAHLEIAAGEKNAACTAMERAIALGFTDRWGPEVKNMRKEHCN